MTSTANLNLILALASIVGISIASAGCVAPHAADPPEGPEPATPGASVAVDPDTPTAATLAPLRDQTTWANAAAADRMQTAERVAATLPGFSFRSMETIETSGAPLEMAILAHAQTGLEFVTDPVLGRGSTQRIRRGGSWKQLPVRQRSAARDRVGPSSRSHHCSFRPIRVVPTD